MITKLISLTTRIIYHIFSIFNKLARKILSPLKRKNKNSSEELAEAQNIKPINIDKIFNTWPGDIDDGFEELIGNLRKHDTKRGKNEVYNYNSHL